MHRHPQKVQSKVSFKTNSAFLDIQFDSAGWWHFLFDNNIVIDSDDFWRILKNDRILYTSFDEGQQFGLPDPLNLGEKLKEELTGKKLIELDVSETTGDLTLYLSDNIMLQVFITSCGYESYLFSIDGKRYIGGGAGDISYYTI